MQLNADKRKFLIKTDRMNEKKKKIKFLEISFCC